MKLSMCNAIKASPKLAYLFKVSSCFVLLFSTLYSWHCLLLQVGSPIGPTDVDMVVTLGIMVKDIHQHGTRWAMPLKFVVRCKCSLTSNHGPADKRGLMTSTTSTVPSSSYFTPISTTPHVKSASTLPSSLAAFQTHVASQPPASSTTLPAASSTPDIGSEIDKTIPLSDEQAYLDGHNEYRAKHGAVPLSWNTTLAILAQQWADGCQFIHSGGPYGGQFSLFRAGSKMSF